MAGPKDTNRNYKSSGKTLGFWCETEEPQGQGILVVLG